MPKRVPGNLADEYHTLTIDKHHYVTDYLVKCGFAESQQPELFLHIDGTLTDICNTSLHYMKYHNVDLWTPEQMCLFVKKHSPIIPETAPYGTEAFVIDNNNTEDLSDIDLDNYDSTNDATDEDTDDENIRNTDEPAISSELVQHFANDIQRIYMCFPVQQLDAAHVIVYNNAKYPITPGGSNDNASYMLFQHIDGTFRFIHLKECIISGWECGTSICDTYICSTFDTIVNIAKMLCNKHSFC